MKKNIEIRERFKGDAERVWGIIAAVSGVDRWMSLIKTCRVEGSGPGARRYCETADGHQLEERVIAIDSKGRVFRYAIERGLPVDLYEAEVHVTEIASGTVEVVWSIHFEGSSDAVGQVEAMVQAVCPAALRSLGEYALQGAA